MNKKYFKERVSAFIIAVSLVSGNLCYIAHADEDFIVEKLKKAYSAVSLAEVIGDLSEEEQSALGIDTSDYLKVKYPECVAEEILAEGFSDSLEFKAAFDSAMEDIFEEKTIPSVYGVALNTGDEKLNYTWEPGVNFSNTLGIYYTQNLIGFDVKNADAVSDASITVTFNKASFTNTRSAHMYSYSFEEYPGCPAKDTGFVQGENYGKDTEIYSQWNEFYLNMTDLSERIIYRVNGTDPQPWTVTMPLSDEILSGFSKYESTPFSVRFYRGDNLAIISRLDEEEQPNPYMTVTYDNSVIYHKESSAGIKDGASGIYGIDAIEFLYNEDIDESSWNSENISVKDVSENREISIETEVENGRTGRIIFSDKLNDETTYSVFVKNIKDINGRVFHDRVITFTTAGIYKDIKLSGKTAYKKGENLDIKAEALLSSGKIQELDSASLSFKLSEGGAFAETGDGIISAADYGYSAVEAEVENIDNTKVSSGIVVYTRVKGAENGFNENGSYDYVMEGESSYVTDGGEEELLSADYSKFLAEIWIYDDLKPKTENFAAMGGFKAGITSADYMAVQSDGETLQTMLKRSEGWHQIVFYVNGGTVIYIDGVKVLEEGTEAPPKLTLSGGENEVWFDNASINYITDSRPVVEDLQILGVTNGEASLGAELTASYKYADSDNDAENGTEYGWYIADDENGEYKRLDVNGQTIKITDEYYGKYIKFSVIPANDISRGEKYESPAYKVTLGKSLESVMADLQDAQSGEIEEIVNTYGAVLGIDTESTVSRLKNPLYVYDMLAGREYTLPSDFKNAFNEAFNKYAVTKEYPLISAVRQDKDNKSAFYDYTNESNTSTRGEEHSGGQMSNLYYSEGMYLTFGGFKDMSAENVLDMNLRISVSTGGRAVSVNKYSVLKAPDISEGVNAEEWKEFSGNMQTTALTFTGEGTNLTVTNSINNIGVGEEGIETDGTVTFMASSGANVGVYLNGAPEEQRPVILVTYDMTSIIDSECTTVPQNGVKNVAHDLKEITFSFKNPIDASSWNMENVDLYDEKTGEKADYILEKESDSVFKIIINSALKDETTYRAQASNIKTAEGVSLNDRYVRFTTESILSSITLKTKTSLKPGEAAQIVAEAITREGNLVNIPAGDMIWQSSAPEVVSIQNDGKIKAEHRGLAEISALYNNYDGTKVSKSIIVCVYNHNLNENFEESANYSGNKYEGMYAYLSGDTPEDILTGEYNDFLEIMFYDDMRASENNPMIYFKNVQSAFGAGIDLSVSEDCYVLDDNGVKTVSGVKRSKGWHQISVDNREDSVISIDGEEIKRFEQILFDTIAAEGNILIDNANISDVSGEVCYVKNVSVRGSSAPGSTLVGSYGYFDSDKDAEEGTLYKWYSSSSENGTYSEIAGADSLTFEDTADYAGKYIKFSVTPKNFYDTGEMVMSTPFKISSKTGGGGTGAGGSSSHGGGGVSSIGTSPSTTPVETENTGTSGENDFSDVPKTHWAYKNIMDMKNAGIINGVDEEHFKPENNVTRAEFAKMIVKAAGIETAEYRGIFDDVSENDWYAVYVQAAFDNGLINGYNKKFDPQSPITREAMVKIVMSAYELLSDKPLDSQEELPFEDLAEISDWAVLYVSAAYSEGIVNGTDSQHFTPKGNTTRAQAAKIISELLNKKG